MKLIDKDDLIDFFENVWDWESLDGITATTVLRQAITDIRNTAPLDIVRCGECKYLMSNGRCEEFADYTIQPSASDFCSYGERRKNETT